MLLDPDEVKRRRLQKGLSVARAAKQADIQVQTWRRAERGDSVRMDTATEIAKALGLDTVMQLLSPSERARLLRSSEAEGLPDWEAVDYVRWKVTASNGITYQVWKMRHRLERHRLARGKRYDGGSLPTGEWERLRAYLARHGEICNRLRRHPQIPLHHTTVPEPGGEAYWVLDEWTPGTTLSDAIGEKRLDREQLPRVMGEIAEGLKALHGVEVICRELSPEFVILRESDGSVVLTDFEVGKLFDGSPTVSGDLKPNEYRAPEVAGAELTKDDVHVDLYSWGRILLRAATGYLTPVGEEGRLLDKAGLPDGVVEITKRCVAPVFKDRPRNVDEVIRAIRHWR